MSHPRDELIARIAKEQARLARETTFSASQAELDGGIQHLYGELSEDEDRNQLILDDVIQATGRYIGEGFDDARLDKLFLAMPVSWRGTLAQYTGRLHRLHLGKTDVRIYDCVDRDVPMLMRMFERRLRAYRAIGYERGESSNHEFEPPREVTIECEEGI